MTTRKTWLTPYQGSVSQYDLDRNRGTALPSAIDDDGYGRIAARLEAKRQKQEYWRNAVNGQPPPAPEMQRQASVAAPEPSQPMRKFASLEAVTAAGFKRVASGMYRQAHDIWELRNAEEGGFCLVRKREERASDLRAVAGFGTAAAVASGVIRTASVNRRAYPGPEDHDSPPRLEEEITEVPIEDKGELVEVGEPEPEMSAEEFYDAHEVAHGREPVYDPNAPLVMSLQDLTHEEMAPGEDQSFGGPNDESDEPPEYDFSSDEPAPPKPEKEAKSPPTDKAKRQVEHITESYMERGDSEPEAKSKAEGTAWKQYKKKSALKLEGKRVLAVHKGGVAEGVVITVRPLGDMDVDFGEGDEETVPMDMILDPELSACPMCGHDGCPDACPDGCPCAAAMSEALPIDLEIEEEEPAEEKPKKDKKKDAAIIVTFDDLE